MTFTEAAREVLRLSGRPLHYKDITELAIEKNLLSHVGKSPEVTMGARLAAALKKGGEDNPLVRVKPGVFALRDWDEETIKQGLSINRRPKKQATKAAVKGEGRAGGADGAGADGSDGGDTPRDGAAAAEEPPPAEPPAPDEELRAEIAASASAVFAEEDDDDQPILKPPAPEVSESGGGEPTEGRRRRRRRRRRGARSGGGEAAGNGLPAYTAKPANGGEAPQRGPQVIELTAADAPSLDGLVGERLADGIELILGAFDRTVGAVSLRQIAETAQRHGKLSGDMQLAQSQIAAAVRADISRRAAQGLRPRYRLAGGRVGLSDWLLEPELARAERELQAALKRYRTAARRAFVQKCAELPAHALIELCATLFERLGVAELTQVKLHGASGAETQLAGTLYLPAGAGGQSVTDGDGLHLAIVIRKDGRDIGRERVAELRGTAHHYRAATMGWLVTTGQILSGAREEGTVAGALPVSLIDGDALARLCAEHGVAVVSANHPVAIADVDLFEALKVC